MEEEAKNPIKYAFQNYAYKIKINIIYLFSRPPTLYKISFTGNNNAYLCIISEMNFLYPIFTKLLRGIPKIYEIDKIL